MPIRILFTCRPLTGHYLPLVPLAIAARDAGHAVAFATASPILDEAEAAGLRDVPGRRRRRDARRSGRRGSPGSIVSSATSNGSSSSPRSSPTSSSRRAPPTSTAIVRQLAPDLVVHEVAELAAPLVCSAAGLPYADLGYGSLDLAVGPRSRGRRAANRTGASAASSRTGSPGCSVTSTSTPARRRCKAPRSTRSGPCNRSGPRPPARVAAPRTSAPSGSRSADRVRHDGHRLEP